MAEVGNSLCPPNYSVVLILLSYQVLQDRLLLLVVGMTTGEVHNPGTDYSLLDYQFQAWSLLYLVIPGLEKLLSKGSSKKKDFLLARPGKEVFADILLEILILPHSA